MIKRNIFDKRGYDTEVNSFYEAVARNQGALFENCEWDFEVDARDFIEKFMNCDIAKSMDNSVSDYHNTGIKRIGESTCARCNIKPFTGEYENEYVLYWMGYIYRYWVYWLGTSSVDVYKTADFDVMKKSYALHVLSPEQTIVTLIDMHKRGKK